MKARLRVIQSGIVGLTAVLFILSHLTSAGSSVTCRIKMNKPISIFPKLKSTNADVLKVNGIIFLP